MGLFVYLSNKIRSQVGSVLILTVIGLMSGCIKKNPATSEIRQETDDRETAFTKNLKNVDGKFENLINSNLKTARLQVKNSYGAAWFTNEKAKVEFLEEVYQRLGAIVPGTGFKFGPFETVELTNIEVQIFDTYSEAAQEIYQPKWESSKYRLNDVGLDAGLRKQILTHMSTRFAQHSLVPVIRQSGILIGTDKWAHFFDTGYRLFKVNDLRNSPKLRWEVSRWLEGDSPLKAERALLEYYGRLVLYWAFYGVYGSFPTGIISTADCYANEFGFQFYENLNKDPNGYTFKLKNFDLKYLSELHTPNKYVEEMKAEE